MRTTLTRAGGAAAPGVAPIRLSGGPAPRRASPPGLRTRGSALPASGAEEGAASAPPGPRGGRSGPGGSPEPLPARPPLGTGKAPVPRLARPLPPRWEPPPGPTRPEPRLELCPARSPRAGGALPGSKKKKQSNSAGTRSCPASVGKPPPPREIHCRSFCSWNHDNAAIIRSSQVLRLCNAWLDPTGCTRYRYHPGLVSRPEVNQSWTCLANNDC